MQTARSPLLTAMIPTQRSSQEPLIHLIPLASIPTVTVPMGRLQAPCLLQLRVGPTLDLVEQSDRPVLHFRRQCSTQLQDQSPWFKQAAEPTVLGLR